MVDQTSQFYAILTNVGAAKQANADALGIPWKITQMAVGDGNPSGVENPALPQPDASWTSLLNEWRRAPLNQLKVDDKDNSIIVAEQVIPAEVGGRWIREVGLYDADGDLVAVANCAPTYKPLLNQGSGRTQVVRMNLIVSSSSNVQLKIDPSVVLATREWVTEELAKQDFKHSVLVATTAAITLNGLQTVDGVALSAGARVLVKNQAAAKDNGLYLVVAGGAWTRCPDADTGAKVTPGMLVPVEKGTNNADSVWQLITDAPITLGVSGLSYEMAFGRTGVTAGTFRSVTVDAYGRVVAATNPTTVVGYGLTDVYTKTQIDQALSLKAPLASPALTGSPTAPTLAGTDSSTKLANAATVRAIMSRYGLADSAFNYTGSIDSLSETGVYMVSSATTGTKPEYPAQQGVGQIPNGTVFHLERGSSNMATQLWDSLVNAILPVTCLRTKTATGTWTPWREVWHAGNTPKMANDLDATVGKMVTVGAFGIGRALVGQDLDLNSYTVPGNYTTQASGLTNLPLGWSQNPARRFNLFVKGQDSTNYITQVITSGQSGSAGDLVLQAVRTMSTSGVWKEWRVQAPLDSPELTGSPVAPTVSRGDASARIATTAFVQNALGNMAGSPIPVSSDTLLTAEQGGLLFVTGSGNQFTLPLLASVPEGVCYHFMFNYEGGSVKTSANQVIQAGGQPTTVYAAAYGERLTLVKRSNAWYAGGGGIGVDGFQSSKAISGWYKLPSGIIEQWGRILTPLNSSTAKLDTVFPIRFPNACFGVVASIGVSTINYDGNPTFRLNRQNVSVATATVSGFGAQAFIENNPADQRVVYWHARGD